MMDESLNRRHSAPSDVGACPVCGNFRSPSVSVHCAARGEITRLRESLTKVTNRADALYQEKESTLSDLWAANRKITEANERIAELKSALENERDAHLEHLETIIVRIATGK